MRRGSRAFARPLSRRPGSLPWNGWPGSISRTFKPCAHRDGRNPSEDTRSEFAGAIALVAPPTGGDAALGILLDRLLHVDAKAPEPVAVVLAPAFRGDAV